MGTTHSSSSLNWCHMKIKTYRFPDSVIQIKWIQLIKRHRSIEQKAKRAMKKWRDTERERERRASNRMICSISYSSSLIYRFMKAIWQSKWKFAYFHNYISCCSIEVAKKNHDDNEDNNNKWFLKKILCM